MNIAALNLLYFNRKHANLGHMLRMKFEKMIKICNDIRFSTEFWVIFNGTFQMKPHLRKNTVWTLTYTFSMQKPFVAMNL